jgi:hypothetical protein
MGTARIGNQPEEDLTKSGVIMGTVNYAALLGYLNACHTL